MRFFDAIKQALFPRWGGSQSLPAGNMSDWMLWHGQFTGTGYDYNQSAGDLRLNPVVMACIAWMQRAFPEAQLQVHKKEASTGEENKIPDHPLPKLLAAPNRFTSRSDFWSQVLLDWVTTGNAYAYKRRNTRGEITEVWNIPEQRIRPQWEPTGDEFIGHYLLMVDGQRQRLRVEDVIHFRFGRHPQNDRLGWSPVLAGLREVAALNEGANYRGALLRNRAVASHLVTAKDNQGMLNKEQAKLLESTWISKTTGDQSGRPLFSNIPLDVTKLGYSPRDLDLGTMLNWDADAVCALIGLSAMLVGLSSGSEHKTYANYAEAREAGFEQCIIPAHTFLGEALQLQLLPDLGNPDTEGVGWDYSKVRILQEDEGRLWERLTDAVGKKPWLTINEARAKVNLPAIEGGDELAEPQPQPQLPAPGDTPESTGDRIVQQPGLNGDGKSLAGISARAFLPAFKADAEGGHFVTIGGHAIFIPDDGESGSGGQGGSAGSASGGRSGMHAASDVERKIHKVPPAWTDVHISNDPNAALQVTGKDSKGRVQSRYSAAHSERQAAAKFARGKELHSALPQVRKAIAEDMAGGKNQEEALVLRLISQTGFRVGSEKDTGARVKAYGASTLRAEHVQVEGNTIHFDFIGKEGVRQRHSLTDPELAKHVRQRVAGGERLFDTNEAKVRNYLKQAAGNDAFTTKDLRTHVGTSHARDIINRTPAPKTAKEYAAARLEVGRQVSRKLGNKPAQALESYIAPEVFAVWQSGIEK